MKNFIVLVMWPSALAGARDHWDKVRVEAENSRAAQDLAENLVAGKFPGVYTTTSRIVG